MIGQHTYLLTAISLFLSCATDCAAQLDVHFSQYWRTGSYYNPASVGESGKLNISSAYSLQPDKANNNPSTLYVGADVPFAVGCLQQGAGAGFAVRAVGPYKSRDMRLQYSVRLRLGGGTLSLGLQGGAMNVSLDPTKLTDADETTDETTATEQSETKLDFSAGLTYSDGHLLIGIAGQHLAAPTMELESYSSGEMREVSIKPTLNAVAAYSIGLRNKRLSIVPSAMVVSDFSSARVDMTGRMVYAAKEKRMETGVSYSPDKSVTVAIGAALKWLSIGYSYEMMTKSGGHNTHELTIGCSTDVAWNTRRSLYKHKSIRFL
jgi:type IX secretion system PorP/SprF family membrane protein